MNETTITLVGNVVAEVRLRATHTSGSVATFRMASSPRRFDRESARWVDGDPLFVNVVCWRVLADNVSASLAQGDPVVVTGRLRQSHWEKDGVKHTTLELDATAVGHDLARGRSVFTRIRRDAAERAIEAAATATTEDQRPAA